MIYLVLSLFCAMVVALFAVQNSHEVMVRFLTWELQTSLALLVIGAVAAGALLLGLLALFRQVGLGLKLWDERSRARKTTSELEQARLAGQELRKEMERLQEQNRRLTARLAESQGPVVAGQAPVAGALPAARAPVSPAGAQDSGPAGNVPTAACSDGPQGAPAPAGPQAPTGERPSGLRG